MRTLMKQLSPADLLPQRLQTGPRDEKVSLPAEIKLVKNQNEGLCPRYRWFNLLQQLHLLSTLAAVNHAAECEH